MVRRFSGLTAGWGSARAPRRSPPALLLSAGDEPLRRPLQPSEPPLARLSARPWISALRPWREPSATASGLVSRGLPWSSSRPWPWLSPWLSVRASHALSLLPWRPAWRKQSSWPLAAWQTASWRASMGSGDSAKDAGLYRPRACGPAGRSHAGMAARASSPVLWPGSLSFTLRVLSRVSPPGLPDPG